MLRCTTDRYSELYAPWLKDPSRLLHLAQYQSQDSLLDLCGGTGAVTNVALGYHAKLDPYGCFKWFPPLPKRPPKNEIVLYDLNPRPEGDLAEQAMREGYLRICQGKAEDVGEHLDGQYFDVVVIRQALAYLELDKVFGSLANIMKPGARLVFNSFVDPLSDGGKRFRTKKYNFHGEQFFEAHLILANRVLHLQAKLSKQRGFDVSMFKAHSVSDIHAALQPHFDTEIFVQGRTVHWLCIRQPFSYMDLYWDMKDKGCSPEDLDRIWNLCTNPQRAVILDQTDCKR